MAKDAKTVFGFAAGASWPYLFTPTSLVFPRGAWTGGISSRKSLQLTVSRDAAGAWVSGPALAALANGCELDVSLKQHKFI